jgi:hypothetical protein
MPVSIPYTFGIFILAKAESLRFFAAKGFAVFDILGVENGRTGGATIAGGTCRVEAYHVEG